MKPAIIRRQYMQPPLPPQFYDTWAVGKEPDALSKLVTGGIFHVQKNCYMLVGGMHPPHPPPWIRHCTLRYFAEFGKRAFQHVNRVDLWRNLCTSLFNCIL